MRTTTVLLSVMLATAFFFAAAPSADAVIYCVKKLKEPVPSDSCDGIVCLGYNSQTGWQNCVPPPIYCLQYDYCCGADPSPTIYCPDPR